jgi:small-conductance mechanosensitive channel
LFILIIKENIGVKEYDQPLGLMFPAPKSGAKDRVINWTLAKYSRRIILTVQTHQKTDTDLVLKIMKEAAYKVEFVLKEPEVKSYFHGINDNQLEFALYYWASGNILDCKSLVNQQVQKALKDAGIEFVMPLHVVMEKEQKSE